MSKGKHARLTGTVKWFRHTDGTGYITSNKQNYYVDLSCTNGKGLIKGDAVTFTPKTVLGVQVATKVRIKKGSA